MGGREGGREGGDSEKLKQREETGKRYTTYSVHAHPHVH